MHEKSAGLYAAGKIYDKAAEEYHEARMTSKALQALYDGTLLDQLVHDLHKYSSIPLGI